MKKTTFKQAFLKKYPKYGRVLLYLNESLGREFGWNDFTKLNILDFCDHISDKVAQSSQKTYCAMIKSVLNMYSESIDIPCKNYASILSIRNVKSSSTWLTEEELTKLITYIPINSIERTIRNQFVIGAYTGCRYSDYIRLDKTNIVNGCIIYVSQKTHIQACVPLKPVVLEYLPGLTPPSEKLELAPLPVKNCIPSSGEKSEYSTPPVRNQQKDSSEKFKIYSDVTFNKTIREICRKCGINEQIKLFQAGKEEKGEKWEFISSHTARRSFATNLYLRGCDLFSISKMMGHTSTEMTERYICCGLKEQSTRVMEYFK